MRAAAPPAGPPGLSLLATLRLGLFQGCLGCLAVIFAGLLNRVMISELALPGLLVGGALAFEQFVAPTRIWFGQLSDSRPLAGRHRVPYIWLGTLLFCGLAVLSVPMIFHVATVLREGSALAKVGGIAALCGLFAAYGLAISLASTPYLALVIDRTSEKERPRAVGFIWCMLTVGIVVGAISISLSLRGLDGVTDPAILRNVLLGFMGRVVLVVLALTLCATLGMEAGRPAESAPSGASVGASSEREDGPTLRQAWVLITSSRQVMVFFSFLVFFNLGLFLQDPILESYGAEVFDMPIAATAALNAYWGIGLMVGLVLAGLWLVPKVGKLNTARMGCWLIALTLALLVLAGVIGRVPALLAVMVLFGLAAGVGTNGALVLMLDFTLPQAAGTFVGVWGLAQALSRALGKVMGGGLLDVGRQVQRQFLGGRGFSVFPAYVLVLGVEILMAITAVLILSRLSPRQFKEDTGRSLHRVLAMEVE